VIQLVAIGEGVQTALLDELSARLARQFRESVHVRPQPIDPSFAYDPVRNQYHATAILRQLNGSANGERLLGVTGVDLYVPIFTFVFGEAQLAGHCALTSIHRLREDYYGLPTDRELTASRLLKTALHELGHTYGLRHCTDWSCPMASSTAVDRIDLKNDEYCLRCWKAIHQLI
jgi:archaemetzincin